MGEFKRTVFFQENKTQGADSSNLPAMKCRPAIRALPEPMRNAVSVVSINDCQVKVARTAYTDEPLGFELSLAALQGPALWTLLVANGAKPTGLGVRDTLRLDAGLPLYGHKLGQDPEESEIPW